MSEKIRARSPVQPGDVVGGKYRVERVLGAGGMGVVVSATHVELGQSVALKFILQEALTGQGAVERFMREARAAVRLKSEHVARVSDVGRDHEDRPYMVLELLEGQDLARVNKTKGPLPVADAVEYVLQACEALVEAHAAGIVHRDLKPQNLFVSRKLNGAPLVKVLDFGIAKAIGPAAVGQMSLTDSQQVIGSPLYMAPEQMRSARTADARTDIWALGVILYEQCASTRARSEARRRRDEVPPQESRRALPERRAARRVARALLAQRAARRTGASVAVVRGYARLPGASASGVRRTGCGE